MRAIALVRTGPAEMAFNIIDLPKPQPRAGEVLIKVEATGLNFADIMARNGQYEEAPPLPAVLGYDVAGTVEAVGEGVVSVKAGDRVTAMTRFGGYAEYAITQEGACSVIPVEMDFASATALTTQYCTAYYAAAEMVRMFKGDKVLIHAGAGGVGTALVQYATHIGCEIFSTAGSAVKINYLKETGVHHPINYRETDFEKEVKRITNGKGVDVIFDAVGGTSVKKGVRTLGTGGRIVCFGAAEMTGKNILGKIKSGIGFGFYHPAMLIKPSKSMIGINMLRIGDDKPLVLKRCLEGVMEMVKHNIFKPKLGKVFPVSEIAAAHQFLESRQSIGKVALSWL